MVVFGVTVAKFEWLVIGICFLVMRFCVWLFRVRRVVLFEFTFETHLTPVKLVKFFHHVHSLTRGTRLSVGHSLPLHPTSPAAGTALSVF